MKRFYPKGNGYFHNIFLGIVEKQNVESANVENQNSESGVAETFRFVFEVHRLITLNKINLEKIPFISKFIFHVSLNSTLK